MNRLSLAAVNSHAGDTQRLTAAYEPMLAGSSHSCAAKYLRKTAVTTRDFDAATTEKAAATLTALADEQLPNYKDELGGLKDSLATVKRK